LFGAGLLASMANMRSLNSIDHNGIEGFCTGKGPRLFERWPHKPRGCRGTANCEGRRRYALVLRSVSSGTTLLISRFQGRQ
jgi:hypothetical protein